MALITNNNWTIIQIEFSNLICFDENNVINFEQYDKNNVIAIFGPNCSGKSAINDIIIFSLYEIYTRSNDIWEILNVNSKNTTFQCSLLFRLNNTKYRIEKVGTMMDSVLSYSFMIKMGFAV